MWSGMVLLVVLALAGLYLWMRSKLAKLFDRQSGDPMPDRCWKWTAFYCNPSDPAWMVPARAGTGGSLNYAQPVVRAALGLAIAVFVVSLLQLARLVPELIRIDSAIGTSLR